MSVGAGGLRHDVAALYVDRKGPYPRLVSDWWDEERDARRYLGPLPVVAHPPCGPWGRLRFLCRHQDHKSGPAAVGAVRRHGGVLEHPAHSTLWRRCGLPLPGELPDAFGGWSLEVRQVAWGHCCQKPTWLYFVRVDRAIVASGLRSGGVPTHRITSGPRGPVLPSASRAMARRTPPAFAAWLLEVASTATPWRGGSLAPLVLQAAAFPSRAVRARPARVAKAAGPLCPPPGPPPSALCSRSLVLPFVDV